MPSKLKSSAPRNDPRALSIDRVNLEILTALQKNAMLSFQELSEAVGLTASPCFFRVKKLEKAGVICGYGARIDLAKFAPHVTVMTEITLEKNAPNRDRPFRRYIDNIPEIVSAFQVSGRFDYLLQLVCRDIERYVSVTQRMTDADIGITHLVSYIILETAKPFEGFPLRTLGDAD